MTVDAIVTEYYRALAHADLAMLKVLMVPTSYYMTLEAVGVRLAVKDLEFREVLKHIEESEKSLLSIEKQILKAGLLPKAMPVIAIKEIVKNGSERQTVLYEENGTVKKMYFSKEDDGWKINYYAGRKIDKNDAL